MKPTYSQINDAINKVLFDGRYRLAPVYLDLEDDLAAELGSRLGLDGPSFLAAMAEATAKTMSWVEANPFSWHLSDLQAWIELEHSGPPPFSALLCTLSFAAERMRHEGSYSSTNYYERLFETLSVDDETRKNKIRAHARSTLKFWRELNKWLLENDFEFGRPTARKVNGWEYVSYALSQALVREADRRRLHHLFVEYGLAPHERLTEPEVALYLHEWMRGSGPSAWLRKIWAVPDLRPRVTIAAKTELEHWDGAELDEGAASALGARSMHWAASLVLFPKKALRLLLTSSADEIAQAHTLVLEESASPAAQKAFADCAEGLWLAEELGGEFSVLEPRANMALSALLLASFELKDPLRGTRLRRVARPILPMVRLDTGAYHREVSRVSLLRPHLILCHEQWRERVGAHLTRHARPGYGECLGGSLDGLPADWMLFTGVEFLSVPQTVNNDLQALIPLSDGAAMEMAGGLRLSQGLWHSGAPPEVTAAAERGPLSIELRDVGLANTPRIIARARSDASSCRLEIEPGMASSGANLAVVLLQGDRERAETSLALRSSANPRRLPPGAPLAYCLTEGSARGLFSATPDPAAKGTLTVWGMAAAHVGAANPGLGKPAGVLRAIEIGADAMPEEEGERAAAAYEMQPVTGLGETCVLRGHHIWHCEEFKAGDLQSDAKWMTCKDCRNAVLTRNRGVTKRKHTPRFAPRVRPAAAPMALRRDTTLDPNLIFDAVCYLGAGKWARLMDLASEGAQTHWFAGRFAASLIDLGHIDMALDGAGRRPDSWNCAPPSLIVSDSGVLFAAGFRSPALIEAISAALNEGGAQFERLPQQNAPDALVWSGISLDEARQRTQHLQDPHGRRVVVANSPTAAIAAYAPTLSIVAGAMPAIHIEDAPDLERFDPGSGRWSSARCLDAAGAYRTSFAGRRYLFKDASGGLREGSYETVKALAAKQSGLRMQGYREEQSVFQAVLGCEPPGLFRRALVACSGQLPVRVGGVMNYGRVPAAVAAAILGKLDS